MFDRLSKGFSLFELLIVIAVIGIVSAFAVPAYRSYIDTANMTKVTANFEQSVRVSQNLFTKDRTRVAIGLPSQIPETTEDWIELFNQSGVEAPGGGPAYIPSTNNQRDRGDPLTGAVGVQWQPARDARTTRRGVTREAREARLRLWRPLYSSLVEQRATITQDSLDIVIQRKP